MSPSRPTLRLPLVALRLSRGATAHSSDERECLRRWAASRRRVAELGVAEGRGTALLRRAMAADGELYAVDPFPPGRLGLSAPRLIARLEVRRAGTAQVTWLETTADAAAGMLEQRSQRFDFVFSDACFDYDVLDALWARWRRLIEPGGIYVQSTSLPVAGRSDETHDTVRWTNDVLLNDPEFERVDAVGTFTVMRRLH